MYGTGALTSFFKIQRYSHFASRLLGYDNLELSRREFLGRFDRHLGATGGGASHADGRALVPAGVVHIGIEDGELGATFSALNPAKNNTAMVRSFAVIL